MKELHWHRVSNSWAAMNDTPLMSDQVHDHERGDEKHKHNRTNGKTYFTDEHRSDGMPVKCEGHPTMEFDDVSDWCYPAEGAA